MTRCAYIDVQLWLAQCRTGLEYITAATGNFYFVISRMDVRFHLKKPLSHCFAALNWGTDPRNSRASYRKATTTATLSSFSAISVYIYAWEDRGSRRHTLDERLKSKQRYRFIDSKNSALVLVSLSLSSRNSIAASSSIGCRSLRRIQIFCSVSCLISNSSRRVPERLMLMAG